MRTSCPVCGADETAEQFQLHEYKVIRCLGCAVEFLEPQPSSSVLAEIYSANYFLSTADGIAGSDVVRLKRQTAKLYVDQIVSFRSSLRGRLLEVGCGSGDLLLEAQSRGFEVSGVETSEHATATANRRLGAELVQRGEIDTVLLPEAGYDVVVFSDVIEHVAAPPSFLSAINRCLRPGGLVFIVTPSTDSWSRRLMGRRWMEYKVEHLFYFNRKSLEHILRRSGFQVLGFKQNVKVLSFDYVRAHFRRFRVPIWTPLVEMIGKAIPVKLARRDLHIVASGVMVTARKTA